MGVTIRHTKSTSGRTHRLTVTRKRFYGNRALFGNIPPLITTHTVTRRYKTAPRFDDQVQGDLIRQYWAEGGDVTPIGRIPDSPRIDPALDAEERELGQPTPRQIAEACYGAIGKPEAITPDQFIGAIMTAVRKDRELYR